MKMILGRKIGMIQGFLENGERIPLTVVEATPNVVLENKTEEKNGYVATKIGYGSCEEKKLNKPELGYFKKNNLTPTKIVKELRGVTGYNVGDKIDVNVFTSGDLVDVQAITKGKGFTGAIKRWNFKVGPLGHGAGYPHRYQGSISFGRGGSQGQRVPKGQKMSGHYGHELVTISNLTIVNVEIEKNLILIKGSVPGPVDGLVLIKTTTKAKKHIENFGKLSDPIAIEKAMKEKEEQARLAAEARKQEAHQKAEAAKEAKKQAQLAKQKAAEEKKAARNDEQTPKSEINEGDK